MVTHDAEGASANEVDPLKGAEQSTTLNLHTPQRPVRGRTDGTHNFGKDLARLVVYRAHFRRSDVCHRSDREREVVYASDGEREPASGPNVDDKEH